jgi:hypothetical protein
VTHGNRARAVRAHGAVTVRTGTVMCSMAARWGLAGSKVLSVSTGGVLGWHWARRSVAGLTQSATHRGGGGSGMARRNMVVVVCGGAGTVVTDDGALALHHGEGESEVRWDRD